MAKDPALLVYTKDFLEGTSDLSPEEMGVYCRLIFHQHQRGKLPTENKRLANLAGCSIDEFTKIWEYISSKFETRKSEDNSEYLANLRVEAEKEKRKKLATKRSILAVLANFIKYGKFSNEQEKEIKRRFHLSDFELITDKELRTKKVKEKLDSIAIAIAKGSHIANGNGNGDVIANGNIININEETLLIEIREDIFQVEFTNLIKKYNPDFHYSHPMHAQDFCDILTRVKKILMGRSVILSMEAIIDFIGMVFQNCGWHKEDNKVYSPRYFITHFDTIITAAQSSEESEEKNDFSEIDAKMEKQW